MEWFKCTEQLPRTYRRAGDTDEAYVVLACGDGREDGLVQVDIMNSLYFLSNWRDIGYTHWMYCPDPPAEETGEVEP